MAEVGGVSYRIEADTKEAIASMTKMQSVNSKTGSSFDALDKKVAALNASMEKAALKVNAAGDVVNAFGQKNVKATEQLKALNAEMKAANIQSQILQGRQNILNANLNKTTKGIRMQKGGLSNLSYQLQDVAVQAQMGTDAFIILGQQAPQALGSFGPGGAVLGAIVAVGAALLGVATNALTSAGAMDEFIKKLKELEDEELADLEGQQQATAIKELTNEIASYDRQLAKVADTNAELLEKEQKLIKARDEAREKGFAGAVESARLAKVREELESNAIATQTLTKAKEGLIEKQKLVSKESNINQETIDGDIKSLEELATATGKSGVELAIYTKEQGLARLATQGATEAELARAAAAYDSVIAFARQTEQEQKATQATKDKAKADRDAAAAERERNSAIQTATGASPALAIGFENQSSQQELQAVYDAGIISEQEFLAQKLALNQQYEMEMAALSEERFRRESEANAFLLDSLDALGSAGTNAMSGLLSGTMDATEAVQSLANTILNQAIGALVQMGIEQVKNQLIGQSGAAAAAATSAATGTAIAAAYATPAALVSLASFGANAAPAAAALTSTTALASGLAIGGRESGGAMTGGGLYNVGEQNKPEVYQTGRGMLMQVPGDGGRMFNQNQLDQIGGGNGAFNITVVNEPGVVSVVVPQGEKDAIIRTAIDKSVAQSQANYAQSMNDKQGPYFKASAQNWGQGKASGRNT